MVGGGPSVLYDAVAIVTSADGAKSLAALPAARRGSWPRRPFSLLGPGRAACCGVAGTGPGRPRVARPRDQRHRCSDEERGEDQ